MRWPFASGHKQPGKQNKVYSLSLEEGAFKHTHTAQLPASTYDTRVKIIGTIDSTLCFSILQMSVYYITPLIVLDTSSRPRTGSVCC